jgi:hypothetical protein
MPLTLLLQHLSSLLGAHPELSNRDHEEKPNADRQMLSAKCKLLNHFTRKSMYLKYLQLKGQ